MALAAPMLHAKVASSCSGTQKLGCSTVQLRPLRSALRSRHVAALNWVRNAVILGSKALPCSFSWCCPGCLLQHATATQPCMALLSLRMSSGLALPACMPSAALGFPFGLVMHGDADASWERPVQSSRLSCNTTLYHHSHHLTAIVTTALQACITPTCLPRKQAILVRQAPAKAKGPSSHSPRAPLTRSTAQL